MMKVDYFYKYGGVEAAANKLLKYPNMTALLLTLESDTTVTNVELTVEDAEKLAHELLEYTEEIRRYAELLKEMERVQS